MQFLSHLVEITSHNNLELVTVKTTKSTEPTIIEPKTGASDATQLEQPPNHTDRFHSDTTQHEQLLVIQTNYIPIVS